MGEGVDLCYPICSQPPVAVYLETNSNNKTESAIPLGHQSHSSAHQSHVTSSYRTGQHRHGTFPSGTFRGRPGQRCGFSSFPR